MRAMRVPRISIATPSTYCKAKMTASERKEGWMSTMILLVRRALPAEPQRIARVREGEW